MSGITKGKWTIGRSRSIVTNVPHDRPGYSWEDKESEFDYYGGYFVCESIMSEADGKLIAAAPELLQTIECIVEANEEAPTIPYSVYLMMKRAALNAAPAMMPTRFCVLPEIHKPLQLMLTSISPNQHHSCHARPKQ